MKRLTAAALFALVAYAGWTSGQSEAAGGATRARYLSGKGIIVQPEEVVVDSYIAQVDYRYPTPDRAIGVTLYTGNRQFSMQGQAGILQIGIQAGRQSFQDVRPLNVAFVIDKSGSMANPEKLAYAAKAFEAFAETVRDKDFVSLVVFDDRARVVSPSRRMDGPDARDRLRTIVNAIVAGGGSNLLEGLRLGYEEVLSNYRYEYVNRVFLLTDAIADSDGIMELAGAYHGMGIDVSVIGLGAAVDLALINRLAHVGGGSSRFLDSLNTVEEVFSTDLGRMAVPAARNLRMRLEFAQPVEILGTWGYEHKIEDDTITYALPTLHHGDYETLLVEFRTLPTAAPGKKALAVFSLSYDDLQDVTYDAGSWTVPIELVQTDGPVTGFSDAMVVRSGAILRYAQTLKRIGELYYAVRDTETPESRNTLNQCLHLAVDAAKELKNAGLRLSGRPFDAEVGVLTRYAEIIGRDLELGQAESASIIENEEVAPPLDRRTATAAMKGLFEEVKLQMESVAEGSMIVTDFATTNASPNELAARLTEMCRDELSSLPSITAVEPAAYHRAMQARGLSPSQLMDTDAALDMGRQLGADYILTGTILEMKESVLVFVRVINTRNENMESVAQIVLEKNDEVRALL